MHTQGHPDKGPDDYLSLYRSEARSAIVRFTGFAALLVFFWITAVEAVYEAGRKYMVEIPNFNKINNIYSEQLPKLAQACAQSTESKCTFDPTKKGITSEVAGVFLLNEKNDPIILKLLSDTRGNKKKIYEINAKKEATKTKAIKLLDYEIRVPSLINGLVLQILILIFLLDIKRTRRRLFGLLIKASNGFRLAHKDNFKGPVKDFAGPSPFWMSPSGLDYSQRNEESNASIIVLFALGWVKNEARQKFVIFAIFLSAFVLLCSRAGYIEFTLTSTHNPIPDFIDVRLYKRVFPYSLLADYLPSVLRGFSVFVFISVVFLTYSELAVSNLHTDTRTDRRLFLMFTGSFAATLSLLLPSDVPNWDKLISSDSPKGRTGEKTQSLDVRFLQYSRTEESRKSTTILVDLARPTRSQPKGTVMRKSFVPIDVLSAGERSLIFQNLPPVDLPEAAELFALQILYSANPENLDSQRVACLNFLETALIFAMDRSQTENRFPKATRPDTPIRLFDLYALLAVLYDKDHLKKAIQLAQTPNGQERNKKRLKTRIKYWQDVEKFKNWADDRKERPWQVNPRGSGQIVKVDLN